MKIKNKRPKHNLSANEKTKRVLNELLTVNPTELRCQAKGWGKRILNYGYQQEDFDKNDQIKSITTRQFKQIKKRLLNLNMIKLYNTKHGKFHSITPLGIAFLSHMIDKFNDKQIKGTLTFCPLYGSKEITKQKLNSLIKGFGKEKIRRAFLQACRSIKIEENAKGAKVNVVTITYQISNVSTVNLFRFFIFQDRIVYNFYFLNPTFRADPYDVKEFDQLLAENIINLFHYYLFKEILEKHGSRVVKKKKVNLSKIIKAFGKKNLSSSEEFNEQLIALSFSQLEELKAIHQVNKDFQSVL